MSLRIAAAQLPVTTDIGANLAHICQAIDAASGADADLLLTPEGSLSGYHTAFDQATLASALATVTAKASAAHLALALGSCVHEADGNCYNQLRFYDADGAWLGFHSKILRCGTLTEPPLGEVNDFAATPLRTFTINGVCVGGLICNDLWANPRCTPMPDPHLTQQLAQLGAQVIVHGVNGGSRDCSHDSLCARAYHEANLLMRARAGKIWIVTVDSCHPQDAPCSSPSGVIAPDGCWRLRARPMGADFFVYDIN